MKINSGKDMRARSVNFERGQNPKSSMGIGHFRYENGDPIKIGDSVYVEDEEDDFSYFTGTVDSFHGEYVTVQDQADDYFDVEIHQIERMDESVNFERGQDPKRAMGIGHHWQLKKVRRKHYYQTWTEFYLYKDGKLYSKGSTQELIRANNRERDLINNPKYYRNSMEFIQAHGLNPKNVESIKESVKW